MKKRELSKVLIILIILILFFYKADYLVLRNFDTKETLRIFKLKEDNFTVAFTHSVMLSEVREDYEIRDEEIILVSTKYKDYGAGLPTDIEGQFYIDKEKKELVVSNINRKIENLVYRAGTKRANHRIIIDNKDFEFLDFTKEKSPVEFMYFKLNLLELIKLKRR